LCLCLCRTVLAFQLFYGRT